MSPGKQSLRNTLRQTGPLPQRAKEMNEMLNFIKAQDGTFVNLLTVHKIEANFGETTGEINAVGNDAQGDDPSGNSIVPIQTPLFSGTVTECRHQMERVEEQLKPLLTFPKTAANLPEETLCRVREVIKADEDEIPIGSLVEIRNCYGDGERYTVVPKDASGPRHYYDDVPHTALEPLD